MDVSKRISGTDGLATILPVTGMAAGTRVRTLDGVLPVEYLQPGDRIVTRSGARRLIAVSVRQSRALDVVRVKASTLGFDRPEADLLLGPAQPVIVRDWRARILYGADVAAVPSARLADGEFVLRETQEVHLYTLRFAEDEVIWAEGLELACPAVAVSVAQPESEPAEGVLFADR
jgi:Hint domain